jgi:hypothetical protein
MRSVLFYFQRLPPTSQSGISGEVFVISSTTTSTSFTSTEVVLVNHHN